MSEMNLCRRNLLKAGAAAAAGIMASAAANAGIPAAKVEKYDEEYDVVIIGSGFAGMACALKAGRAGKKVLMLEKCRSSAATPSSAAATLPARSTPCRRLRASRTAANSSSLTA